MSNVLVSFFLSSIPCIPPCIFSEKGLRHNAYKRLKMRLLSEGSVSVSLTSLIKLIFRQLFLMLS